MDALVWPLAAFLMFVFALVLLRAPLTRLLDRIKGFSLKGLAAETTQAMQAAPTDRRKSETSEIMKLIDGVVIQDQMKVIRNDLDTRSIADPQNREDALIRALAATQLARAFDLTYYLIYGSQIVLLQRLNPLGELGCDEGCMRPLYDAAAAQYPNVYKEYDFGKWINFLASMNLITTRPGHVQITPFGREFLRYLTEVGRPLDKNF